MRGHTHTLERRKGLSKNSPCNIGSYPLVIQASSYLYIQCAKIQRFTLWLSHSVVAKSLFYTHICCHMGRGYSINNVIFAFTSGTCVF